MRWILSFLWLMLAACSHPHAPAPLNVTVQDAMMNETVISKESGFFNRSQDVEWLSSQTDPGPAAGPKMTEKPEVKTLPPRLFPTHYDWPYWLYSVRFSNTLRYK